MPDYSYIIIVHPRFFIIFCNGRPRGQIFSIVFFTSKRDESNEESRDEQSERFVFLLRGLR